MEISPEFFNPIIWYAVFLFSTTVHEAAHAWSAYKMGDPTAYEEGQVSLNPVPHMKREPIGTIVVPAISFFAGGWMIGWASTPYNYNWAYKYPKKAAAMSAAGPMSNFLLILFAALLIHIGIWTGNFYSPETLGMANVVAAYDEGVLSILAKFVSVLFSLNLILFIFNLIPFPPLDGSGILPLYLNDERGRKYMNLVRNSAFAIIGLLIAWQIFGLIHWKLFVIFINLLYPGSNYQ